MKEQIKNMAAVTAFMLIGIVVVITNFQRIARIGDYIRGFYIESAEKLLPGPDSYRTIDPAEFRRYAKNPVDGGNAFFQCGPILLYIAPERENIRNIALKSIRHTEFFKLTEFLVALKRINGINNGVIEKNTPVVIPGSLPPLVQDIKNRRKPELRPAKGLYFTGQSAGHRLISGLPALKKAGINTIVFDAKDVSGIVNYRSGTRLVREYGTDEKSMIDNIDLLIRALKENGMHTIARIAVFSDRLLAKKDRKLAIQSKSGGLWAADPKEVWCDPTNKKVQDYNLEIALELASLGVDEIQFDYIRFPTTGNQADANYRYDFGAMPRTETITRFLKRAYAELSDKNVLLSIDIFGVVAWGKDVDIIATGQQIGLLSEHCDVISPMLYPSHFNDEFDGYGNPGDHPYYFIHTGCRKVMALMKKNVPVRPWLQAFRWRVSDFNRNYILEQMRASDDAGALGYLFWNASNEYDTVREALTAVKATSIKH